ncbi:MAG: limonene-1,2-epoxide hydrolase family protein [Mycetocola sp.]
MTMTAGEVVDAFLKAVLSGDVDGAKQYLAEDVVFDNVPQGEASRIVIGRDAVADRLRPLFVIAQKVDWEIILQVEQGNHVFNERLDRMWFAPGTFPKGDYVHWPVIGRWDVEEGKIKLWRDYYELDQTSSQLGVDMAEFGRFVGKTYAAAD